MLDTVFCLHQVLVLHKTLKWWGHPGGAPTSFWATEGCLRKSPCPCSAGPLWGLACTLSNLNNCYNSISKKGFHGNLRQYICGLETIVKAYKICPPVNSNSKWEEKGGSMCHSLLFLSPKSISLLWGISWRGKILTCFILTSEVSPSIILKFPWKISGTIGFSVCATCWSIFWFWFVSFNTLKKTQTLIF